MLDIAKLNIHDDLWSVIEENRDYFMQELYKEVSRNHVLYGVKVKELARREDCDDVLFQLLDGSNRYAVVHLTWTGKEEVNFSYPITRIYDNLSDLINSEGY